VRHYTEAERCEEHLCSRADLGSTPPDEHTVSFLERHFREVAQIAETNNARSSRVTRSANTDAFRRLLRGQAGDAPPFTYRNITGNQALAYA